MPNDLRLDNYYYRFFFHAEKKKKCHLYKEEKYGKFQKCTKVKDTTTVSNHIHTLLADFLVQQNLGSKDSCPRGLPINKFDWNIKTKKEGFMLFQESRRGIIWRKRVRWKQE